MRSCQAPYFENLIGAPSPPQEKKGRKRGGGGGGGGGEGGCILFHVFVHNDLEYVIKRFLFVFLFRMFSFLVEMCNRNVKWHCAFTRSQSPDTKFHCKIWLGIEILWLFWFINDAIIKFSTRKFVIYLIWNLSMMHWTFYSIIIGNIQWRMQWFFGDITFSSSFGSKSRWKL